MAVRAEIDVVDVEVVTAAQAGDAEALDHLVREHMALVYNVVGRALGGHADTDDVVQEVVVRVVQNLAQLKDPATFRSWLMAITMRQIQERHRVGQRTARRLSAGYGELAAGAEGSAALSEPGFEDHAVESMQLHGERRELELATRWLDQSDRDVLSLWWHEAAGRMSRAEVAKALGLSQPHTAVKVQRMKTQLRTARLIEHALAKRPGCGDLRELRGRWDGTPSPLWRKRFARHVRGCPRCGSRLGLTGVPTLLAGVGLVPLAAGLKAGAWGAAGAGAGTASGGLGLGAVAAVAQVLPVGEQAVRRFVVQPKLAAAGMGVVLAAGGGLSYTLYTGPSLPEVAPTLSSTAATAVTTAAVGTPTTTTTGTTGTTGTTRASSRSATRAAAPGVTEADYYVAVDGDDGADGSKKKPFASIARAVSVAGPGDVIAVRGGTYRPTDEIDVATDGTGDDPVVLSNYAGETPVLDGSGLGPDRWLFDVTADHWTIAGLEITGVEQGPVVCTSCTGVRFERLQVHDNGDDGLVLRGEGTSGNTVVDSDFYANHDDSTHGENGSGVRFTDGSGTGNTVVGVRAYRNADSGVSLYGFASPVTLRDTWSFDNGYDLWDVGSWQGDGYGFQLGGGTDPVVPVDHVLVDCAAWGNAGHGFTDSGNLGRLDLTRTTAYGNGGSGYQFEHAEAHLTRALARDNDPDAVLEATGAVAVSSALGGRASTVDLDGEATAEGPRPASGRLPRTGYLTGTGSAQVGADMQED